MKHTTAESTRLVFLYVFVHLCTFSDQSPFPSYSYILASFALNYESENSFASFPIRSRIRSFQKKLRFVSCESSRLKRNGRRGSCIKENVNVNSELLPALSSFLRPSVLEANQLSPRRASSACRLKIFSSGISHFISAHAFYDRAKGKS